MDCRKVYVAVPIWLMAWSLTTQFYGPIPAILVLITAWLFARSVTGTRRRNTTRPWLPRRYANGTNMKGFGRRGTRFQAGADHGGKRRWMEG